MDSVTRAAGEAPRPGVQGFPSSPTRDEGRGRGPPRPRASDRYQHRRGVAAPRTTRRPVPMDGSRRHASLSDGARGESASTMRPGAASRLAWSIGSFSIALMPGALVLAFVDRHAALPDAASSARWNFSDVLNAAVNIAVPAI